MLRMGLETPGECKKEAQKCEASILRGSPNSAILTIFQNESLTTHFHEGKELNLFLL